jgi:DNA polymerase-3 subunit epsilon
MSALILGYDTETSNLPNWREPSDHPSQPHLMQIAMILSDVEGNEVERFSSIVQPGANCVMSPEAFAAHGISIERAMDEGIEATEAVDRFMAFAAKASLLVGHNESFDRRIMRIAASRHRGVKWEPTCETFCTLNRSKHVINLPPTPKMIAAGVPGPKSPNLGECIQHFFNEPLVGAHDALVDVEASLRVFWHLTKVLGQPMYRKRGRA